MASLYIRDGVWYYRFWRDGQEFRKSTGIKAPAKGTNFYKESKLQAEAVLYRKLAERTASESIEALVERLEEAIACLPQNEATARRIGIADRLRRNVSARLSIDEAWDCWVVHPNRGIANNATVNMYLGYWGRKGRSNGFRNWLAKHHSSIRFLNEITESIAEDYAAYLRSKQLAPRSFNGAIKFLFSMFKTLRSKAGLHNNIWESIRRIPNQTEGRRNLSLNEINKVCAAAEGEYRHLIILGLYTGLRLGDCATLKWDAGWHVNGTGSKLGVFLDEKLIRIIPSKTKGKNKSITIPLHPILVDMLGRLRKEMSQSPYLFPSVAKEYTSGRGYRVSARIQKLFQKCGIQTTETIKGRERVAVRVGFHSLRHSFVSLCASNNVPQTAVQELVGHGNPAMTALYTHVDHEKRIDAIECLPSIIIADQEADVA
jgi:integrase